MPDGSAVVGGSLAGEAWLARFEATGGVRDSRALPDRGTIRALAVLDDDTVVATGDAWLAAYDLETSEELWARELEATEALALTVSDQVAYVTGHREEAIWVGAYRL